MEENKETTKGTQTMTEAKKRADVITTINNPADLPLQNIAKKIGIAIMARDGFYACSINGKKHYFELAK